MALGGYPLRKPVLETRMRPWILVFCALLFAPAAWGEVRLNLQISDSELVLGDQVLITLEAEGAEPSAEVEAPKVQGLQIEVQGPPSSSSQTTLINGQTSHHSSLTYHFGVTADRLGKYEIEPFVLVFQGQRFESERLSLLVVPAPKDPSMKLTLKADRKQIYLGEPLTVGLEWSVDAQIAGYEFRFPLLADKDQLKLKLVPIDPNQRSEQLNIDQYKVQFQAFEENRTRRFVTGFKLYPHQTGAFVVPAAHIKVSKVAGYLPGRDFFGRLVQQPRLITGYASANALKISVLALPLAGRPANFGGAVGQYQFKAELERPTFDLGESINLKLIVEGVGELDKIGRPLVPALGTDLVSNENLAPGKIEENRVTFFQKITPKKAGKFEIPPVGFAYFDPQKGAYQQTFSEPLKIEVLATEKLDLKEVVGARPVAKIERDPGFYQGPAPQTPSVPWGWFLALPLLPLAYHFGRRTKPAARPAPLPWSGTALKADLAILSQAWEDLAQWRFGPNRRWDKTAMREQMDPELLEHFWQIKETLDAYQYGSTPHHPAQIEALRQQLIELANEVGG